MRIELSCSKCGSNRFDYPIVLTDNSSIVCADCGHEIGTVAALQHRVVQELERRAASR